jgi:hypothetical protein
LDLRLVNRMLLLPCTQRICHQSGSPGRSRGSDDSFLPVLRVSPLAVEESISQTLLRALFPRRQILQPKSRCHPLATGRAQIRPSICPSSRPCRCPSASNIAADLLAALEPLRSSDNQHKGQHHGRRQTGVVTTSQSELVSDRVAPSLTLAGQYRLACFTTSISPGCRVFPHRLSTTVPLTVCPSSGMHCESSVREFTPPACPEESADQRALAAIHCAIEPGESVAAGLAILCLD